MCGLQRAHPLALDASGWLHFYPTFLPPRVPLINSERNSGEERRKEEGLPLTDGRPLQGGRIDSPLSLSI